MVNLLVLLVFLLLFSFSTHIPSHFFYSLLLSVSFAYLASSLCFCFSLPPPFLVFLFRLPFPHLLFVIHFMLLRYFLSPFLPFPYYVPSASSLFYLLFLLFLPPPFLIPLSFRCLASRSLTHGKGKQKKTGKRGKRKRSQESAKYFKRCSLSGVGVDLGRSEWL